jgi:hypothetical protein
MRICRFEQIISFLFASISLFDKKDNSVYIIGNLYFFLLRMTVIVCFLSNKLFGEELCYLNANL